jgi:hypothetical protein
MFFTPFSSPKEVLTKFPGVQEVLVKVRWVMSSPQAPVQGSFIDKQGQVSSTSLASINK